MDWAALIAMVIQMIQDCLEDRKTEEIAERLNNPGFLEALALRRALKDQGFSGRELHEAVREGMEYLADMDSDEVAELLMEAVQTKEGKSDPASRVSR